MFISRVKSKGRYYLYLYGYLNKDGTPKIQTLYSFGNKEIAIQNMRTWFKNFDLFPKELIEFGCNKKDLEVWIRTLETGVTKTGKKTKKII